jgi:hypothetical protein
VIDAGLADGEFQLDRPGISRLCMQGALSFLPDWYKASDAKDDEVVVDTLMAMFKAQLRAGSEPSPRRKAPARRREPARASAARR